TGFVASATATIRGNCVQQTRVAGAQAGAGASCTRAAQRPHQPHSGGGGDRIVADVLLTHGYFLYDDPHELAVMKPYPPLGLLYISSHLKAHGVDTQLFDTTFARFDQLEAHLREVRPPVVGVYSNLMTRTRVLQVMEAARRAGSLVVV